MSLISPRPSAAQNVGGGAMDSGVAPHSRGALISFCAGLLLAAPFRCRWPAFPLFRAASPCGLCPVARRQISPWHAFYFISESTGCHKRTRCDECLNCLNPKLLKRFGCLSGNNRQRQCSNASEETRGRPPAVGFRSCSGAPFACRT